MDIFARSSLVAATEPSLRQAVLLEGSWHAPGNQRWSLDDSVTAAAGWIDDEAIRLSSLYANQSMAATADPGSDPRGNAVSLAYVHERKLRYYLARLLRVIAFFDRPPAGLRMADAAAGVRLHLAAEGDDDYAALFAQLARRYHWDLQIVRAAGAKPAASRPLPTRRVPLWRRLAARWLQPGGESLLPAGFRVVLCGNAQGLDPVCEQLLARHAGVSWLYDVFCLRTWRRWRRAGVRQLLCHSADGPARVDSISTAAADALWFDGICLSPILEPWRQRTIADTTAPCAALLERIEAHFARLRPHVLVVDEDQTPLARIAVHAARRQGIPSIVLQHGVPRVAFGFVPLAADWFFAWGESSRRQLVDFGVPGERIAVTGSARHDALAGCPRWQPPAEGTAPPEILFFATTPPSVGRPEPLRFNLTEREHDRLLRMTLAEAARLGARLTIKTHPRAAGQTAAIARLIREFPAVRARVIAGGELPLLASRAACAVSCASGAGNDAAALGLPVIDLLPQGGADLMPSAQWGTIGTASTADQLRRLLAEALSQRAAVAEVPHVFAHWGYAASVAADAIAAVARGESPVRFDAGRLVEHEHGRTSALQRLHRLDGVPAFPSRRGPQADFVGSGDGDVPVPRVSQRISNR